MSENVEFMIVIRVLNQILPCHYLGEGGGGGKGGLPFEKVRCQVVISPRSITKDPRILLYLG